MRLIIAAAAIVVLSLQAMHACAASLVEQIKTIKPSVVGVGTYLTTRRPPSLLMGTGMIVADGYHVITNWHVVPNDAKMEHNEKLVIFYQQGDQTAYRNARVLDKDVDHDLALLRIDGTRLPAVKIDQSRVAEEGEEIAFTGFPIGTVLGFFPATHKGIIAAVTPIAIPASDSRALDARSIKRLREPYLVYQLDAVAYPGNSGSPVYSINDGKVLAVINKVFVKQSKENVLKDPSGITYAIPAKYVLQLLKKNGLKH